MSLSDAAGSSAPEAARAAAWVETLRGDWTQLSTAAARAMALADLEVAAATSAAVAEERATTGRRIEAVLVDWFGDEAVHAVSISNMLAVVRTALASEVNPE